MDTTDLQSLREDLNNLKDTVTEFVSQAGIDAVKTARDVTSNVAAQVGNATSNVAEKGSEIATITSKQAKTFASELETLGRKNPIGAMVAAMMVGVLIGLIGRGRT
jgi:ElaB/YqjD/DUF883 family membrane-anchored ribosome-binding protein